MTKTGFYIRAEVSAKGIQENYRSRQKKNRYVERMNYIRLIGGINECLTINSCIIMRDQKNLRRRIRNAELVYCESFNYIVENGRFWFCDNLFFTFVETPDEFFHRLAVRNLFIESRLLLVWKIMNDYFDRLHYTDVGEPYELETEDDDLELSRMELNKAREYCEAVLHLLIKGGKVYHTTYFLLALTLVMELTFLLTGHELVEDLPVSVRDILEKGVLNLLI